MFPFICCCIRNHPRFATGVGVQGIQTCDTLAGFPEVSALGPGLRGPSRWLSGFCRPLEMYTKREAMRSHVQSVCGVSCNGCCVPVTGSPSLCIGGNHCKQTDGTGSTEGLQGPRPGTLASAGPSRQWASPRLVVSGATARPHSPSMPRLHPQIGSHGPAAADISLRWSHTPLFPTDCFS